MGRVIKLYSTDCVRCNIVKQMLNTHKVKYKEIHSKEAILDMGFDSAPILEVDGKAMEYHDILIWLEDNGYYSFEVIDDD